MKGLLRRRYSWRSSGNRPAIEAETGLLAAQIFVEIERARLTKQLAKLKEEEGKVDEAAEILQEVAVVRHSWSTSLSSDISVHQAQMAASQLHLLCKPPFQGGMLWESVLLWPGFKRCACRHSMSLHTRGMPIRNAS